MEIHVPNKERRLQPGMFATATLYLKEHKSALAIPPAALISGNDSQGYSVFVVDQGKARRVPITTGLDDGVWVEVTNGLTGDEDVVLVGKSGLAEWAQRSGITLTTTAGRQAGQAEAAEPQTTVESRRVSVDHAVERTPQ